MQHNQLNTAIHLALVNLLVSLCFLHKQSFVVFYENSNYDFRYEELIKHINIYSNLKYNYGHAEQGLDKIFIKISQHFLMT